MPDFDALPTRTDVVNAYRLALGRDPENDDVIADRLGQRNREWFPPFFASSEFRDNVVGPIVGARPLVGGWFDQPPSRALIAWVADFVPLAATTRGTVQRADDWPALFHALCGDAAFVDAVLGGVADPVLIAALEAQATLAALATVKGAIEGVDDGEVRGWAIDTRDPARAVTLELLIDGRFAAAAAADGARGDEDGKRGFVLRYTAPEAETRALTGEVRDLASGASIARFRVPGSRRSAIDALAETRAELAEVRALLDRIEARLPDVRRGFGFPLAAWDGYFRTYYAAPPPTGPRDIAEVTVMLDAAWPEIAALDAMLASLFDQTLWPCAVIVRHDDADTRIETAMRLDVWRARFGDAVALTAADAATATTAATTRWLMVCTEPGTLAPDAIALLAARLGADALIAYGDDDIRDATPGATPRHRDPRLRGGFDSDQALQRDETGPLVAIAIAALADIGLRFDPTASAPLVDLTLRLCEAGARDRIAHVARVLLHRLPAPPADPAGHHDAVAGHLARIAPATTTEPHHDALGAAIPGALRIRRPIAAGTRIAILIPTRDRIDLLGPCLDSIARSVSHNRAAIEVVVIDNRSAEAATGAYLDRYSDIALFRVLAYDGAFNWAAINNHAAAAVDADVLVFLNNDTVVLAPDCWDELAGQALRPSIGAVGARLLFQDGTIQHAGMVTEPWHSFASHEGVGEPASDPGYLGRHALVRQVSTVTGACLATRAALFGETGGFDALAFPAEGNDTDYCLRLRARGYDILYDPFATLYHFESRTRGYNDDDAKRRRAWLATQELRARWADPFAQDRFYNAHFDRLAPPCTRLQPPPIDG